jgi:hypothetical protein
MPGPGREFPPAVAREGHQRPAPPPGTRPLAGAEQRVQRGAQRAATDGAEGTGVGDGLEAGWVLLMQVIASRWSSTSG